MEDPLDVSRLFRHPGRYVYVPNTEKRTNWGFVMRNKFYNKGKSVKTVAKLIYPLSQRKVVLPPGINMKVSLKRNSDDFIMLSPDQDTKFIIEDIYLTAKLRTPTPQIFEAITKQLIANRGLARYPFNRTTLAGPYTLVKEATNEYQFTIFKDVPPSVVFLFAVDTKACQGDQSRNPFKLKNLRYKSLTVECEGVHYPSPNGYYFGDTFKDNVHTAQCKEAYLDLYKVLNQYNSGDNCGLTFEDFVTGNTVIGIQLSEILPSQEYNVERKTGDTRVHFELAENISENVNFFAMGVFSGLILIDSASGLSKNFLK